MRRMRKLEAKHIAPERERPFEIRDGNARVIGGDDAEGIILTPAHDRNRNERPTPNAQRPTFNSKAVSSRVAETTRDLSSALSVTLSNLRAYCPLSEILHRLRGSG